MNIIVGTDQAESMLKAGMLVLELETLEDKGGTAYCVVPADKIHPSELSELAQFIQLHKDMVAGLNRGENPYVLSAIEHLKGKFGGELDTFYLYIEQKLQN